jgi:predicted  nucleic acid-binding Zn-ribbon protein
MPELTENQGYAKAKELENVFKVFSGVTDVFRASDEAKKTLKHTKEQLGPVKAEMKKMQDKKALIEKDLVDIEAKHKARKKQIDEAESTRKSAYQTNLVKWDKEIADVERRYKNLSASKKKEYDDLITEKARELAEKEQRLAEISKEYDEFVKIAVGG